MKLRTARAPAPQRHSTGRPVPGGFRRSGPLWLALLLAAPAWAQPAGSDTPLAAQPPSKEEAQAPVVNSALDAPLLFLLLTAEMEARAGLGSDAFNVMLDAARRSRDPAVFQRAIEIAVQNHSGDQALAGARAWRYAMPDAVEPLRTEVQLLVALEQLDELSAPLHDLLDMVKGEERAAVIAGLPRFLAGARNKVRALAVAERTLADYLNAAETRTAARTALGRLALGAELHAPALSWARQAHQDDPGAPGPVLLALDLMTANRTGAQTQAAETLVQNYLARTDALPALRLAYVQVLEQQQRLGDAVIQLRLALAQQPDSPQAWLTLGAYLVELQEPAEATKALQTYLDKPGSPEADSTDRAPSEQEDREERAQRQQDYAWMLMAEALSQQGQYRQALTWLDRIDPGRVDLPLLTRRGLLMVRQGQLEAARSLVRDTPVRGTPTARSRLLAEVQVLREAQQWQSAYDLVLAAMRSDPADDGLIYELAMLAERLARYDDMEVLLKRVMALKPEDAHAYNALGYSLAERDTRLDEARSLVQRANELAPEDPFIIDSLGWVAFRQGDMETALKLLTQSNQARPHVEVAAHLGEVLWTLGRRDDALRVWRAGQAREPGNPVLRSTLQRLRVSL